MGKKAFILSVSVGFAPGLLALVEAMKVYGHREDLHVLLYDDFYTSKYGFLLDKIREIKMPFNIFLVSMKKLREKYLEHKRHRGWECRFLAYPYMVNEISYDSYCIWAGDLLLLNNISKYLDIGIMFTVLSSNMNFSKTKSLIEERVRTENPHYNAIVNVPFITSDKKLLWQVWKEALDTGNQDMLCIYNAIVEIDAFDRLLLLPRNNWTPNRASQEPVKKIGNEYYMMDGSRLNSFHGPLWDGWGFDKERFGPGAIARNTMFREVYLSVAEKYGLKVEGKIAYVTPG